MFWGVVFTAWVPKQLAPNDGTDTTFLPLEDQPATLQDEFSPLFEDELGAHTTPVPAGFQNAEGAPNPDLVEWHWDDDLANDDPFLIEACCNTAPVDAGNQMPLADIEFDQADLYDDPVMDMAEAMQPVQAQAPPDDLPAVDDWHWDEFAADAEHLDEAAQDAEPAALERAEVWFVDDDVDESPFDESEPVGTDATAPAMALSEDWPWDDVEFDTDLADELARESGPRELDRDAPWFEDPVEDIEPEDAAPVGPDAVAAGPMPPSEDWDWTAGDDVGHAIPIPGGYQNSDNNSPPGTAEALPSGEDWDFDVDGSIAPISTIDSYQQSDGEEQPVDDPWQWDEHADDECGFLDPAPGADAQPPAPQHDAWDWAEPADDAELLAIVHSDDDAIAAPASAELSVEDAWPHLDEFADDHWQEDVTPVGADLVVAPSDPAADAWDWLDETPDLELAEEYEPVGADVAAAPLFIEAWDFGADVAEDSSFEDSAPVGPDAVVVAEALVSDEWDWTPDGGDDWTTDDAWQPEVARVLDDVWPFFDETVEDDYDIPTGDAPFSVASAGITVDDAWDFADEFGDHWQEESAPVVPNSVPNPLLAAQDQWPWFDEQVEPEDAPIEFHRRNGITVTPTPRRRFVVFGQSRGFVVKGHSRVFIVKGKKRTP